MDPRKQRTIEALLRAGELVAFPTETVYGLGADARDDRAVAAIFAAKGRPAFNPLIAHVADAAAARSLAIFDAAADALAGAFWPGPLTLVLPKAPTCPVADLATAGAAVGAPPIVVVGTTGDPATPYENTAALANMLGVGHVLTWEGEGHTAYPSTPCIVNAVDDYLIDLKVPQEGLRCPPQ